MTRSSSFDEIVRVRTREAMAARIESLTSVFDRSAGNERLRIGNAWTRQRYGGDFELPPLPDARTAVSLVFVQSRDGNTVAADPSALGGGATDKHLIYEGLSRVAADAVMAGAGSTYRTAFFSVWHPELVSLRYQLGLPRHPAQVVISRQGHLDFEALLFNVPDVPVFLIAGGELLDARRSWLRARPWIHTFHLSSDEDLGAALDEMRVSHGITRISAIGGRFTATRLVDMGLAQDLYLTTTSRDGGEPGTPWYSGRSAPALTLITRKQWTEKGSVITFDHFGLGGADQHRERINC